MSLKKRSKANAEFNMSSLTDIIFLLLIFFMLTSGLVAPNALNLKLPGSSNAKNVPVDSRPDRVDIEKTGNFFLNGRLMDREVLAQELQAKSLPDPSKYNILIAPEPGTPVEHVVAIMDIALRLHVTGILAAEENNAQN